MLRDIYRVKFGKFRVCPCIWENCCGGFFIEKKEGKKTNMVGAWLDSVFRAYVVKQHFYRLLFRSVHLMPTTKE